jgi:hypothetical protein
MTAPVRTQRMAIDPGAVFVARAEARALLWASGEIDLHTAIDELWADAVRDGLVAKLGVDEVQRLLSDAFAPVRDDLPRADTDETNVPDENNTSTVEDSTFAAACRKADEKQFRKPRDPRIERARTLMDDDVSHERAWREFGTRAPGDVPIATLYTAEFLVQQNDPQRFKAWLARHSHAERQAIRKHLSKRDRS